MKHTHYEIPTDGKVMACLDVSDSNPAVIDYAAWASKRLSTAMICLHVLNHKTTRPTETDYSGSIGVDAGSHLLDELVELEARQNRIAMQQGSALLKLACERASAAGGLDPRALQRHGPLFQALVELEDQVRLFVLGKRGESADVNTGHLGANLERVVRSVHRPTLVTPREYRDIQRFGIAFDGSPTTRKCVNMVAMSPLLEGLDCHLIVAADPSRMPPGLDWAMDTLREAGFEPTLQRESDHAEQVIATLVERLELDLLVMGAYGHSRIRHLIVGSTTTAVLRHCNIPILLLR